jgi:predicted DNA binding CopG/RHH family protein
MNIFDEYMKIINYEVTSGSKHCWNCYGDTAYEYSRDQIDDDRYSISMVFDTIDKTVYELTALDYDQEVQYRWINPKFKNALKAECKSRNFDFYTAFDNAIYNDIDDIYEMLSTASGMLKDTTTVAISLEMPDDLLSFLSEQAHEVGMPLNQYIESILTEQILTL